MNQRDYKFVSASESNVSGCARPFQECAKYHTDIAGNAVFRGSSRQERLLQEQKCVRRWLARPYPEVGSPEIVGSAETGSVNGCRAMHAEIRVRRFGALSTGWTCLPVVHCLCTQFRQAYRQVYPQPSCVPGFAARPGVRASLTRCGGVDTRVVAVVPVHNRTIPAVVSGSNRVP